MTIPPALTSAMPSLSVTGTVNTSAASTYTDINGLSALKKDPNSPEAVNAMAQQVEALFLQMMLKSMRDANTDDDSSNEMGMYQDMFDKQVALTISQHQDLGFGAVLRRQLSGKTAPAPLKAASSESPNASGAGGASSAAGGSTAALAQTPAEFVAQVMPTIQRAASALGVDPKGLLAQAALETGWGQRLPRNADGSSSLNLFGIKAGDEWAGARATADTVEFTNGVATPKRTAFRAYGSIEESVADFAHLLKNSPRYRDAVATGRDSQAYIEHMGKSGYATDPDYGNKLNTLLNGGTLRAALGPRIAKL